MFNFLWFYCTTAAINFLIIRYNKGIFPQHLSCTLLWLAYSYQKYYINNANDITFSLPLPTDLLNDSLLIQKCNFNQRIENCRRNNFMIKVDLQPQKWTAYDSIILSDYLIPILSVILSFIGIFANVLVICIVKHKINRKDLKEMQYDYMIVNAVMNIIVLVIEIFKLMSECQLPFGLYCSQIHYTLPIQYYKIIVEEFASNVFQFQSNLTYLAFSLCRLSLIGTENGKVVTFVSTLKIIYYILISSLLSVLLSLVKIFRYQVNFFQPQYDYPFEFEKNPFQDRSDFKFHFVFILNGIIDFLNYVVCVLVNLIIDVVLMVELKRTLKKREEKLKTMHLSEKQIETKKKENKDTIKRVRFMVLFNALVGLLFKMPTSITSLNDLRIIIFNYNDFTQNDNFNKTIEYFSFNDFLKYLCSATKICLVIRKLESLLNVLSLTINILFFYNFDKKFKSAFIQTKNVVFTRLVTKKNKKQVASNTE